MLISILQINALGAFDNLFARLKRRHSPLGLDLFKYFIIPFFVSIISIPVVNSGAPDLTEIPPFNDELDKILKKELPPNCEVSCQLADLQTGRILMEKNPNKSLNPASTLKVITSASALTELGSNFRFLTAIYTDDIRSGSVGNLFVKGHGDPHLVTEELFALVHELIDNGLIEIRGSIVVDDSYFTPDKPLDATEDPGYRSYDALYSALSLNFNSLKITVIPGVSQSRPARLIVDPASDYATVSGRVQTVAGSQSMKIDVLKKPGANDTQEHVIVRGTIGVGALSKGKYVNIQSPAMYTGYVLKELLLKEGIKVKGGVVKGLTPPDAIPYFEHQSMPLGLIVYWLGKMSSNFMAEQICLAMGAHAFGAPGTREKGLDVMRKFLVKAGVTQENLSLVDASGLSRDNKISASALVKTLAFVSHNFYCSPEFISSLGISGVDGTLKEKFTQDNIRRRIRAKTGTLRGVNALAGFGLGKNGKPIVFAILVNSSQKGAGLINYADRVIRSIFSRCLSH
ncbi:MAG: D-alanyl-D-alanine carboxypeptidase/D-alanyl-D-alanine endopeptidase [Desulfomonilaceae bacterium]